MGSSESVRPVETASDPLAWIDEEAATRREEGLSRSLVVHGEARNGRIEREGRSLINFASNDYLALAADPRVVAAAQEAAGRYGWGAGASPLVTGWRTPHQQLADALAEFEHAESCLLFPTGFAANVGAIVALIGRGDVVYSDRLNHSCLISGSRQSGATVLIYPHADVAELEEMLARDRGRFRRSLIVTDGVFSMDGDIAPMVPLADVAERFGAMLLVDEAHATGVIGPDGRGSAAEYGVAERITVRVGTFSKALGSIGGFVVGSRRVVEQILNRAPTLIFSTALPPAAAAAAKAALAIARAEPWRRERLAALRNRLDRAAVGTSPSQSAVVPLIVGDAERTMSLAAEFRERGLLVPAIRPPSVPDGTSRLRISVSAAHSDEDLEALIEALRSLRSNAAEA
jgi:8-amino-7-oxononanoate synthase